MSYQKISEIINDAGKPREERRVSKYHWFECVYGYGEDYEQEGTASGNKEAGNDAANSAEGKQEKGL
jgi:hypothetical protein